MQKNKFTKILNKLKIKVQIWQTLLFPSNIHFTNCNTFQHKLRLKVVAMRKTFDEIYEWLSPIPRPIVPSPPIHTMIYISHSNSKFLSIAFKKQVQQKSCLLAMNVNHRAKFQKTFFIPLSQSNEWSAVTYKCITCNAMKCKKFFLHIYLIHCWQG